MKFASGWRLTEWNLDPAGGWLNEICIRLAANQMQILQKYSASTLYKRLVFCKHAGTTFYINYNMYRRNINIKPKCGQQTGKALSNYERFSPSQSHETVPLNKVNNPPLLQKTPGINSGRASMTPGRASMTSGPGPAFMSPGRDCGPFVWMCLPRPPGEAS
jgi:hypothetical protein